MAEEPSKIQWSASLRVGRPSQAASKALQGDKILLPQSALEQLLAASPRTVTPSHHTFTAFDPFNPYSVAAAQHERSLYQQTQQQLPNPLMFRLANQKNGNVVYAGIREFSAAEGEVVLSPYLMEALGIQDGDIKEPAPQGPVDLTGGDERGLVVDLTGEDDGPAFDPSLRLTVTARQLPKGAYVRLRPLEAGYDPDDWKSLLERQLRASFTTLTKDALLSVHGVEGEEFKFLVDKFRPDGDGICVVDTDLEVDIEALNEEQARETMRQIAAKSQRTPGTSGGSSVGGEVTIWKVVDGQVLEGDYINYELLSWDKARAIEIELLVHDGHEVDLFVSPKSTRQRALPRDSEHVLGDFSSLKDGIKRIVFQPTNVALEGAESLLISIHGFTLPDTKLPDTQPRRYKLSVKAVDVQGSAASPIDLSSSPVKSKDEEQCKNCLQWIPSRTMFLHQNFCLRNNVLCPQCHSVFQKTSAEWAAHWHCPEHPSAHGTTALAKSKHDYVFHGQHTCPGCGPSSPFTFPSLPELASHRTSLCPHKLILCAFCHLAVPQEGDPLDPADASQTLLTGLTAHERADGARTTDCHLCAAIVRLRDMPAHLAHHELDKAARSAPDMCRNHLCGRTLHGVGPRGQVGAGTLMGQGPGNELGLCSLCFGPLYVSLHDPEGRALRRRIERRYLSQVMAGCGKRWCRNEWCKTGRANLGLAAVDAGTAAALALVKPLVASAGDRSEEVHFCVDEGSQRRRKLAEMIAAEGGWDVRWCIAACEAEGGDLDRTREWLRNWAPVKSRA